MSEPDLRSVWMVLETEAARDTGIQTVPTGLSVMSGEMLVGADAGGARYLLVPLRPGEAFAEDRRGQSVHLLRLNHGGHHYVAAKCVRAELRGVFERFVFEVMHELDGRSDAARAVVASLAAWRKLFSDAHSTGQLEEHRLVGLLAELLVLEEIVVRDDLRRTDLWLGPTNAVHDFVRGNVAIEVKGTLVREGRRVGISSVDQLKTPAGGRLFLFHHRFDRSPNGQSIPQVVERVLAAGVDPTSLREGLEATGYWEEHSDAYRERTYELVDRHMWDVETSAFPKITHDSFISGAQPAGTLNLSYTIELSNEPPYPLGMEEVDKLIQSVASS